MRATAESPSRTWTDVPRRIAEGWDRFWFTPGDPLPLGMIRICAGLVFLYVHLAYSGDLQALLGRHAWVDLRTIDAYRKNAPNLAVPLAPVDKAYQFRVQPELPITEEQRQALIQEAQKHGLSGITSSDDLRKLKEEGVVIPNEQRLMYFVDWGVDPGKPGLAARGIWKFSVWLHVTEPAAMVAVHVAFLFILVCFTLGFCTRITSVLTWIGVVSYIQRTPTSIFGMDTMMNIVAIYLMIGPSGATLSLDRLITHWWTNRRGPRAGRGSPSAGRGSPASAGRGSPDPAPRRPLNLLEAPPLVSANLALRLLQVHLCIIYLGSGLSKLLGVAWWRGTAVWFTVANPEFSPLRYQFYLDGLHFLVAHPLLWYVSMNLGALFTLFFEISFTYLAWPRRTRWVMLAMALLMHTGIAIFMGLVTFSLMMACLLMAFVPAEAYHRLLEKVGERLSPTRPRPSPVAEESRVRVGARPQPAHSKGA